MALNLNNGGGDFLPHIRYMASTSSWSMSGENGQQQFQFTQAIFDLENIRTGWCLFVEATAPEWVMDANLQTPAAKPSDGRDWKRGFKVNLFSKSMFGGEGVREFATSATGAVMSIAKLYEDYEAQVAANPGKLPVVEYKGSVPQKVGKGNTTVPTFVINKFVDRPAELTATPTAPVQQVAAQQNNVPVQASNSVSEF